MVKRYTSELAFTNDLVADRDALDLGAGEGRWAAFAAQKGVRVVAIDQRPFPSFPRGVPWLRNIFWIRADITQQGLQKLLRKHEPFDYIVIMNLLQFLPREFVLQALLPGLKEFAKPGCLLCIRTFWAEPKPPFDFQLPSVFQAQELIETLTSSHWKISKAEEIKAKGPGYHEQFDRLWFLTDIIASFS